MKTKTYSRSYYRSLKHISERCLLQMIRSISKDLHKETDLTDQLLKKSQRDYYLQELVRRDETTLL